MAASLIAGLSVVVLVLGSLCVALIILGEKRRVRRARARLQSENREMTDEDFATCLDLTTGAAREKALAVRRLVAEHFGAPVPLVNPDTKLADVSAVAWDGGDDIEFIISIEQAFGVQVSDGRKEHLHTVRQLVQFVIASRGTESGT